MEQTEKKQEAGGIEERFHKLDEILNRMQDEHTGLEAAFQLYEEGMKEVQAAEQEISRIEKKLQILQESEQTGE